MPKIVRFHELGGPEVLKIDDLPSREETAFPVSGRIQAGASADEPVKPGHAVRIFTGAPMPEGAGTVFMQEDVRIDEQGKVVLPPGRTLAPSGKTFRLERLRSNEVSDCGRRTSHCLPPSD